MTESIWTHLGIAAGIVLPLGSGILWLIVRQSQNQVKLDLLWEWYTNGGHEITGGDKYADIGRKRPNK